MRATLSVPAARDPEVLERLDSTPLCNLSHLYQSVLNKCATEVSSEQEKLTKQIALVGNSCLLKFSIFYYCTRMILLPTTGPMSCGSEFHKMKVNKSNRILPLLSFLG